MSLAKIPCEMNYSLTLNWLIHSILVKVFRPFEIIIFLMRSNSQAYVGNVLHHWRHTSNKLLLSLFIYMACFVSTVKPKDVQFTIIED